ncbi:MAG: hypothetical protein V2A79_04740 [Planctomycetota bacterium]
MRTTIGAAMRTVAVAGAVTIVALVGQVAAAAEASPDVKLLYGFEPEEIVGQASQDPDGKRGWKFVGKPWTGDIKAGWRVKDHLDELKVPADHDGPVTIYVHDGSQDRSEITLYRTGATQGKYARPFSLSKWVWGMAKLAEAGDPNGHADNGVPPLDSYHSRAEHMWQRSGNLMADELTHGFSRRDWSAYDRLRIDVYATGNPVVLGVRVHDASGAMSSRGYLGKRTELAVFKVPKEKQVTLDFPMAEMAEVGEVDLSQVRGFLIQLNGYAGEAEMYVDNIRLVTRKAAEQDAKYPLIAMEGKARPFARKVIYRPTQRFPEKMKRKTGPIDLPARPQAGKLGPVDIEVAPYDSGMGHFGGSGACYFQHKFRGSVAFDNDRLCLVFGGGVKKGKDQYPTDGFYATASFDGGATWGGLKPGDKEAVLLEKWYWRSTLSSDTSGDIYLVGTENCASYVDGYDTLFRRLAFTGEGWEEDRVSVADQNMRKCPGDSRAWRLSSGRIWLTWDHRGIVLARYSDDDGYTWAPCKDASITKLPRPFYEPELAGLKKPPEERKPPESILLWPSTPVPGATLLPYEEGVAAIGGGGWQVHDGKNWGPKQKVPLGGTATILGRNHIFLAQGGRYGNADKDWGKSGPLKVADLQEGKWNEQTLEPGEVRDAILTASRHPDPDQAGADDAVFCFYVKVVKTGDAEVNEVRCRRWKNGRWGEAELLAAEKFVVNHVAAPIICPPDYAAVFWDQRYAERSAPCALRFMRIPNK